MYLDVSDVDAADMTMPDRFISGVYTVPATNWSSVGAATRSAYLIQVTEGLRIMRFAVVPSTLMVLDAIVQAQWSVILGGAFLGFTFALSFAMFGPFAGEAYRLFVTVFNLVMTSWIVSSFQGMLVAWLFYLSVSGTALGVIVISAVLVVVYVIFMLALIAVGARVFFLSVGVLMPDMPDALHGATRRVGGAVIGGVVGGVAGAIGMTALDERTPGPIPNVEA
jgi:hypothetical protein